jgi:hypothetical protein
MMCGAADDRSKPGFVRAVDEATATSSLGAVLRLGEVKEREAYAALDWLLERQSGIENGLARRHLKGGVLVVWQPKPDRAGSCVRSDMSDLTQDPPGNSHSKWSEDGARLRQPRTLLLSGGNLGLRAPSFSGRRTGAGNAPDTYRLRLPPVRP